ncbi:MAG: ribosomal RNA small subunit methyltransferase A [Candidatus Shikimatogenerans sp. AspAUS03]|uniref:rRNA adenine N-6-methyltransferase family protein n=1 Tax=Candidatus Shikimatogenerans sp. AspAUS03 TaxID=3158563 RepID=A0AAU7QSG2_9FLAO
MLKNFIIKKFKGQIFLKNKNLVNNIIKVLECNKNDILLEIGPGLGILTDKLKLLTKLFICVEIDKQLVKYLKLNILNSNNLIYNMSILDYRIKFKQKIIIIGNIPYCITKKIFFWILKNKNKILKFLFLIQKELANNILNYKFNNKLSILLNTYFKVKKIFNIKKNNFYPIPKVDSTLVFFVTKINVKINYKIYNYFLKKIFKKKRKKIYNSLALKKLKYKNIFNKRIEQINLKNIIKLYKYLLYKKYIY